MAATVVRVSAPAGSAATVTSHTMTLTAAPAVGNSLIVVAAVHSGATISITGVTDNAGNTYAPRGSQYLQSGSNTRIAIFDCLAVTAAPTTVTITTSAAALIRGTVTEASGIGAFDTINGGGAASTTTPAAPSITTTQPGSLIVGGINYGTAATATDSNAEVTARGPVTNSSGRMYSVDGIHAAAGAVTIPWTLSAATTTGQVIAAYSPATTAPPAVSGSATLTGSGALAPVAAVPVVAAGAALSGSGALTAGDAPGSGVATGDLINPERGFFHYTETHYQSTGTTQSDAFTGTNGAAPSSTNWVVSNTTGSASTIQSNALRLVTGTAGSYNDATRLTSTLASAADVTVTLDVTPTTSNEAYFDIMLRAAGSGGSLHQAGYKFELTNTGGISIQRVTAFSGTTLVSGNVVGFAVGTAVHLEATVSGSTLQFWAYTGTRPSTPTISVTNSTYTAAGNVGFYLNGGNAAAAAATWTVDNWSASTGGGSSGYLPLVQSDLATARASGRTLVFRYIVMERYRTQDTLDAAFLSLLAADFATVRAAGMKMIIRFTYSTSGVMTPPYNADPPVARVLTHIAQLASTVNAYADVIDSIQAGLIGMWGEWYYTDNYGDLGSVTTAQWADRKAVVDALLSNFDSRIFILLRYVGAVRRLIDAEPANTAYATRLGHHNDAFLADPQDWGTYDTFSASYTAAQNRAWLIARNQGGGFPQGGESANPNSPRSDFPSASQELSDYRWSFLNPLYHPTVLASWGADGQAEVGRRLGYAHTVTAVSVAAAGGGNVAVSFTVTNTGYAAGYRNRPVLVDFVSSGTTVTRALATDFRTWTPGVTNVSETVTSPGSGTWAVYLRIADQSASLASNPLYTVRVGGLVYDTASGRNTLATSVTMSAPGGGGAATMSGSGDLTSATAPGVAGAAALTGSGALTPAGIPATSAAVVLSGAGSLGVSPVPAVSAPVTLTGTGALTPQVGVVQAATSATLGGSGQLTTTTAVPRVTTPAILGGSGALTVAGFPTSTATAVLGGGGGLAGGAALGAGAATGATAVLGGAGALTTTGVPQPAVTVTLGGLGTLTAAGQPAGASGPALAGVGSMTAGTVPSVGAAAMVTGTGVLAAAGVGREAGASTATVSGSGSLTAFPAAAAARGAAVLSGAGALAVSGQGSEAGLASVALTGTGALTVAGSPAPAGPATLAGAGTLTGSAAPAASGSAAVAGSGTLTVTVTTPRATGGVTLSGSGAVTVSASASQAGAGSAALVGAGALAVAGAPRFTVGAVFAGTGGLTVSAGVPAGARAAALVGTGVLTVSPGVPAGAATGALAGSGVLTGVGTGTENPAGSITLVGAGTLTAGAATGRIVSSTTLTGTGVLSGSGRGATAGGGVLTGAGDLVAGGGVARSGTADLAGDGALTTGGRPGRGDSVAFTGTGTLTPVSAGQLTALAQVTGLGDLAALGVPALTRITGLAGNGTLAAAGVGATGRATTLSGTGVLAVSGRVSLALPAVEFTAHRISDPYSFQRLPDPYSFRQLPDPYTVTRIRRA